MQALARAARWMIGRLDSLIGTYRPYERRVLCWLAVLRGTVTAAGTMALWHVQGTQDWPLAVRVLLVPCNAALISLLSADFVEHLVRRLLLGYAYNPFVSAIGEWEGYMGPTRRVDAAQWNAVKCGPTPALCPWWGDPGSGSFCR